MYSDIAFYSFPEEDRRRLINSDRVATTDGLLSEVPEGNPPLRIFEESLGKLVVDRLERGQYTIGDLAGTFEVRDDDIRKIINSYRRRYHAGFKGRYSKQILLEDRQGVIRIAQQDGRTTYYTLAKIPYFARLADPTLCVSLLSIDKRLDQFPMLVDEIPAGKAAPIDEEYALVTGDFWGIDPQEVFDHITEFDRGYVETTLMPFPIVDATNEYESVTTRFRQPNEAYNRFRMDRSSIRELGETFVERADQQAVGIRSYQQIAIELADLKWYAQLKAPKLLRELDRWVENVIQTLNPEIEPVLGSDFEKEAEPESSIEDLVLSALSPELQTPEEVHESLPPIEQAETSVEEVMDVLNRLTALGVVNKVLEGETDKYNSDSGSVSFEALEANKVGEDYSIHGDPEY